MKDIISAIFDFIAILVLVVAALGVVFIALMAAIFLTYVDLLILGAIIAFVLWRVLRRV